MPGDISESNGMCLYVSYRALQYFLSNWSNLAMYKRKYKMVPGLELPQILLGSFLAHANDIPSASHALCVYWILCCCCWNLFFASQLFIIPHFVYVRYECRNERTRYVYSNRRHEIVYAFSSCHFQLSTLLHSQIAPYSHLRGGRLRNL